VKLSDESDSLSRGEGDVKYSRESVNVRRSWKMRSLNPPPCRRRRDEAVYIWSIPGRYNELITTYRVCESRDMGISAGSREYSARRALS